MNGSKDDLRPVGLLILAAGASTRFGRPKQLLPYRGRSLLRHAAETALGSTCRPIVVVLGAHAERLAGEVSGLPVRVVVNPRWPQGMGTSLRAGLEALCVAGPEVGAALITLCDQPLLSSHTIDSIVERYRESRKPIVASEYGDVLGVPALFDRALFEELLALGDASGAKEIIARRRGDVCAVPFPEGAIDIDTPQDFEKHRAATEECDRLA
jgi:molybdenum cofactor cytidylyltransferase